MSSLSLREKQTQNHNDYEHFVAKYYALVQCHCGPPFTELIAPIAQMITSGLTNSTAVKPMITMLMSRSILVNVLDFASGHHCILAVTHQYGVLVFPNVTTGPLGDFTGIVIVNIDRIPDFLFVVELVYLRGVRAPRSRIPAA